MKNEITANFTKLNLLSELVPLRAPLSVAISPNNICNIQCQYCYHGSKKKRKDIRDKTYVPAMISEDCFERIVSQLEEFDEPIKQITLIGLGEPLVNQNLPDMIHALKARVAERVKISSNALLLTSAQHMGNIFEKPIKDLWNDEFMALQKSLLQKQTPTCAICQGCKRFMAFSKPSDIIDGHEREILGRMN